MARERRLYRVSDFCRRRGYDVFKFYDELKKYPSYSERLRTNEKGEYVIDRESLVFVGEILQTKKDMARQNTDEEKTEKTASALAREMNSLADENKRLNAEVKKLKIENLKLRNIAENKVVRRRKKPK